MRSPFETLASSLLRGLGSTLASSLLRGLGSTLASSLLRGLGSELAVVEGAGSLLPEV
ncbi:hypothetical protein MHN80_21220 [Gordonia McavH-238-E]|uniref:hypothetical protein n=1 Tax=Gordonia sp. McavH-238-E TaxID=2917736 RepID=UPI001EF70102|nr:hypothetical protein [Gordonia sp. McavH-238-E]MCG7634842.1 hypothetical protein [Gordonia sp. McavH-238-E]